MSSCSINSATCAEAEADCRTASLALADSEFADARGGAACALYVCAGEPAYCADRGRGDPMPLPLPVSRRASRTRELFDQASAIAQRLLRDGVQRDTCVAVCSVARGPALLAAILGVWQAGAAYLSRRSVLSARAHRRDARGCAGAACARRCRYGYRSALPRAVCRASGGRARRRAARLRFPLRSPHPHTTRPPPRPARLRHLHLRLHRQAQRRRRHPRRARPPPRQYRSAPRPAR